MLQKMCESLGFNTVAYDAVKVWFQKFKAGIFSLKMNYFAAALFRLIVTSLSKSLVKTEIFQHELLH